MTTLDSAPLLHWDVGSPVTSVAVSHNSFRVATASVDKLARIWDMRTGTLTLSPIKGHTDSIQSIAWSHDDKRLVSGSDNSTIQIWDTRTGGPVGEPLRGHTKTINSVAFSHDSTRIVSGSTDSTIRIWNGRTGATIGEPLVGHTDSVRSVAFSHDSTHIASCSYDGTIRIWNTNTGAPIGEPLRGHTDPVESVAFSHDGTRIISGSWDNTVRIWDARTGNSIGQPLQGHTGAVNSVAFSHDSTRIVSGSSDRTIRFWETQTGAPVGEPLEGHTDSVWSVAFSPDSIRIVSSSIDATLYVWEAPPSAHSFDRVTSNMSTEEMFECLVWHGCNDLSSIHDNQESLLPITNGGFGDVWRITLKDGLVLAMKTLRLKNLLESDPKGAKRAAREVHHWSRLWHPNVQELLGIVVFRDALGMVSPWLEHGNLRAYIDKHPEVERYPLYIQLAAGVSYLHSVGMVHGDLRAANVLISDDGTPKINDFDYAVLSGSSLRFSTTTRQGGGTMRWMAPELHEAEVEEGEDEGEHIVARNRQTDIYALGMTILEILTGADPFAQYRTDLGVCKAVQSKEIPMRPSQLSGSDRGFEQLWNLLVKCWSHDPVTRPDATTVLQLLRSHEGGARESAGVNSASSGTLTPTSASISMLTSTLS